MHQRLTRTSDMSPLSAGSSKNPRGRYSSGHSVMPSQFPSNWSENSFIMPLDSRKAELQ